MPRTVEPSDIHDRERAQDRAWGAGWTQTAGLVNFPHVYPSLHVYMGPGPSTGEMLFVGFPQFDGIRWGYGGQLPLSQQPTIPAAPPYLRRLRR